MMQHQHAGCVAFGSGCDPTSARSLNPKRQARFTAHALCPHAMRHWRMRSVPRSCVVLRDPVHTAWSLIHCEPGLHLTTAWTPQVLVLLQTRGEASAYRKAFPSTTYELVVYSSGFHTDDVETSTSARDVDVFLHPVLSVCNTWMSMQNRHVASVGGSSTCHVMRYQREEGLPVPRTQLLRTTSHRDDENINSPSSLISSISIFLRKRDESALQCPRSLGPFHTGCATRLHPPPPIGKQRNTSHAAFNVKRVSSCTEQSLFFQRL